MKNSKKQASKARTSERDPLAGDLSHLLEDVDVWHKARFEFKPKNKTITLRLNEELLEALKKKADSMGLDYQKLIRLALERIAS